METDFPPKPPLPQEVKPSPNRSLMSLFLFVLVFFLLFGQDLRFLIVMIGVLAIHELGHFMVMQQKGFKDMHMFFVPVLGAYLEDGKTDIPQKERITIIMAGPAPGIIFGLLIYFISTQFDIPDLLLPAQIFLFLNVFNLLPFSPLDGGRLVETLYFDRNHTVQIVTMIIIAALLAMMAVFSGNLFLLIIPIFLVMSISARMRLDRIRKGLLAQSISFKKSYEELTDEEYWKIREALINSIPIFKNSIDSNRFEPGPIEMRLQAQIRFLLQKPPEEDLTSSERTAILLVWILLFVGPMVLTALWTDWESLNP
jgi:Zn-dependent protease